MNTKRRRRLNVRWGEIGDISESISRRSSSKDKQRWEVEQKETGDWKNSADTQNWENWDPNSKGYDLGLEETVGRNPRMGFGTNSKGYDLGLEETVGRNPRMGFGIVNRKRRLRKQRAWSMSSGGTNSAWQSWVAPEISNITEKTCGYGDFNGHSVDNDCGHLNYVSSDRDEDAFELKSNDSFPENSWKREKKLPSDLEHCLTDRAGLLKKPEAVSTIVNDVKEWLMDLGLGKYADLFEMHEVDAEALPLLTYEDLEEMGITALGTRRRIYSAIRLLNKGSDTTR